MTTTSSFMDRMLPFQVEGLDVRGRLVRLGPLLDDMCRGHDYPAPVATMLSEAAALALVLSSALKYDGLFTLQVQSDGPVGLMVVDVTSEGHVRGHARFDHDKVLAVAGQDGAVVPRLLGAGHMAFTVDQGPDTDRYQGIVALEGATLTDCAHAYFRQSEQMETAIQITARDGKAGHAAGALMIQRLPDQDTGQNGGGDAGDDAWRRAVVLMSSLSTEELLDGKLDGETVLFRLYHEDGVRVFPPLGLAHVCRCSRERVGRTLKSFPRDEIMELAEDGGGDAGRRVTVTCEFCKTVYAFAESDLDALFA